MSDKLLAVKDNGLSGLAIQRIEAADAKEMIGVPDVDSTLAVSGAAAEAKVTGDKIGTISEMLNVTYTDPSIFVKGAINSGNGTNTDTDGAKKNRFRTEGYLAKNVTEVSVLTGYKYVLLAYSGDTYIGNWDGSSWITASAKWHKSAISLYSVGGELYNYRLVVALEDNGQTSEADFTAPVFSSLTDQTLSQIGKAADAKATGDEIGKINDVIDDELKHEETSLPIITYTDGYTISTVPPIGAIIEHARYSVSQKISLEGKTKVCCYYTGTNTYGNYAFYTLGDEFISREPIPASTSKVTVDVPTGAGYVRFSCMTSRKNVTIELTGMVYGDVYNALAGKQNVYIGTEKAGSILKVGSDGNIVVGADSKNKPIYGKSRPTIPLIPEMCADFAWCSMLLPPGFTGKNVVMDVSGEAGSNTLTVNSITGATMADMSEKDIWIGGVLTTDGNAYTVYNFKYASVTTITIYPALTGNLTNATLATLMYDSGYSGGTPYVGLHLTEHGYKAYAYYLYNASAKHSEHSKYLAIFKPYVDGETIPFTKYGGRIYTDIYHHNRNNEMLENYTPDFYRFQFASSYTPYEQKTGVYWEVDLKGQSGYVEVFLCAISNDISLPVGQEIHVDVYINGEIISQTVIGDKIGKRICVDFENARSGKIDIYANKWAPISGGAFGFYISRIGWWVNELKYESGIFPKGSVIAQEFDSWGVFHDGVSGTALSALHNAATGVTVPFTNHSLGSQTTAWGMSWFYENIWKYNPSVCVTDFLINDGNSLTQPSIPATIEGPDGTVYNNKITESDYVANQSRIASSAISNNIQPILTGACRHGYTSDIGFFLALLDGIATEYTADSE